jgi:steroid delta-isomerase-like uncharacterized protein
MSIKENKALIHQMYELLSMRKLDAFFECFSPECITHNSTIGDSSMAQVKERITGFMAAFPDATFTVEDLVAEGDRVVLRETMRGTQKGVLMDIPPTGNKIEVANIAIYKIAGGKVAEKWETTDFLSMLQQLGATPKK